MVAKYFKEKSEKMIPYKQASTDMREKMSILEKIAEVIRP